MNTPLNDVKQWFYALDLNEQHNLNMLFDQFFHKKPETSEKHNNTDGFLCQLESVDLDSKLIIQKTLYLIKLIDFCIDSCLQEENLEARLHKLLETRDEYAMKGMSEIANEMLNQFQ